ncbi:type II secretion system protein F [Kineothrix sedimenti]|uniref:Type II secretion system protein F n=1 Tax=Kineothrix sedimenti TaxID=3123317 RepID=A0ABZ3EVN8_9FIRM
MLKSLKWQAYLSNKKEIGFDNLKGIVEGTVLVLVLALFFYRSLWGAIFLSPLLFLYMKEKKKAIALKKRREIQIQFKDAILSVSANQKAGYSVENSFKQAYADMVLLYGKNSLICRELYIIGAGLGNNVILEKLLYDFAKRSQTEDVLEFAQVFAVAKRSGGNMTEIIERSASVIDEKVETEKEIQVLLAARQMEQKIMNVIPFGIVLYIQITSKGFFDILYHNLPGIIIMTACLAAYIAAVMISRKIVNIEI